MKSFFLKTGKLFFKQTITAVLFAALMLGMQASQKAPFSSYAEALGKALRYESSISCPTWLSDILSPLLGNR